MQRSLLAIRGMRLIRELHYDRRESIHLANHIVEQTMTALPAGGLGERGTYFVEGK